MANLLSRRGDPDDFPTLDAAQRARCRSRITSAARLAQGHAGAGPGAGALDRIDLEVGGLAILLEELETEPAPTVALELLEALQQERLRLLGEHGEADAPPAPPIGGIWLAYRPDRSLETGESAVASRGLFDARDRPPLGGWIEAVARPATGRPGRFELAILAWIPASEADRAFAGCAANATGALQPLGTLSAPLAAQLDPLLGGSARG